MFRFVASAMLVLSFARAGAQPLEEIVVTGEFRERPLDGVPASISVLRAEEIANRPARHLEEILALAPNVNVAGGSSRSRFFQIRGIGERGQFDEPLNPSVGLIVDGIDLSAAASAAALFDVEQVEIFRGPQGTRYGANALAGLINVRTRAPTESFEARATAETANYGSWTLGGTLSGPLGERLAGRFAAQVHRADGFIENAHLGRDDTNERDEVAARARLRWTAGQHLSLGALLGYVDLDNGYDAFSLDNDRTTRSDEPGSDAQKSVFGGLDVAWDKPRGFTLEASAALASSDSAYGYDEDWTYAGFHPAGYSSTDYYFRDRRTATAELRLLSNEPSRIFAGTTDWVAGLYAFDSDVDMTREYTFFDAPFSSTFSTERVALFGQLDSALSARTTLSAGVRYERHRSSYSDSRGAAFSPDDDLIGGRLSIDRAMTEALTAYASLSRGYKAGGFNTDGTLDADLRRYDPETLTSAELGVKGSFFDRLDARVALFHMVRDEVQIASSITRVRDDGSTEFIQFTGNAAEGTNRGLEVELAYAATERLQLRGSLGLLDSEYESFVNSAGEDLGGREQAHAPGHQFAINARYRIGGRWFAELGVEGRDAFYFSDGHSLRSDDYQLVNAAVGFASGSWDARLWGRNLTDEELPVRGYYFGNDPRIGYAPRGYTQLGEPRRIGLTLSLAFD